MAEVGDIRPIGKLPTADLMRTQWGCEHCTSTIDCQIVEDGSERGLCLCEECRADWYEEVFGEEHAAEFSAHMAEYHARTE